MNIVEHMSLLYVGVSFGYMPRSGIAGSSGNTISNFLRHCQNSFQSGCTSLQSHQQCRSVPLSPHPHQDLLSPEFLILAMLIGVRRNLRVVFICISLMTKDAVLAGLCVCGWGGGGRQLGTGRSYHRERSFSWGNASTRSRCKAFSQFVIKRGGPLVGGAISGLVVLGSIRE